MRFLFSILVVFSCIVLFLSFDGVLAQTNYRPFPNSWGSYDQYGYFYPANTQWALENGVADLRQFVGWDTTTVLHNGNPSVWMTGSGSTVTWNVNRPEIDCYWLYAPAGSRVVMQAWMKSEDSPYGNGNGGLILGFDAYGSYNRILEVDKRTIQSECWVLPPENRLGEIVWFDYGQDWLLYTLDVTIPYTYFTVDDWGNSIPSQQIQGLIGWFGGSQYNGETNKIWISEMSIYLNPESIPTPTPYPTPYPTATPYVSPLPSNSSFHPVINFNFDSVVASDLGFYFDIFIVGCMVAMVNVVIFELKRVK